MKTITHILLVSAFILTICYSEAQVAVNRDGTAPHTSAALDIQSDSLGFLPPRLTNAQRDAIVNPAEGLLIYNTNTHRPEFFDGNRWRQYMVFLSSHAVCGQDMVDDRDGKIYGTLWIGSQCWMKDNLNQGIRMDQNTNMSMNGQWDKYCYDDLESNCDKYGALYQWDEIMGYTTTPGIKGICPTGWHIPTDAEWKYAEGIIDTQYPTGDPVWDGTGARGTDVGLRMKSASDWYNNNGNNASGFRALPGGKTYAGSSSSVHYSAYFWTSDQNGSAAWMRAFFSGNQSTRDSYSKLNGYSLRCIRD